MAGGWSSRGKLHTGLLSPTCRRLGNSSIGGSKTQLLQILPRSRTRRTRAVKNHIRPGINALRLDQLRVADVQAWLNPKTEASEAWLPMPDIVAAALKIRRTQQDVERRAAGEIWRQTNDMPSLIFTGRYGTPIDPPTLNGEVHGALRGAGSSSDHCS